MDFVNGFGDNSYGNAILNYGDAYTYPGRWSEGAVQYVMAGRPGFYGLPETYSFNQKCYFTDGNGCSFGMEQQAAGPIEFKGQMTQCQEAYPSLPHHDCNGGWAPYQGWDERWNTRQSSYPGVQNSTPFSTNIKDQGAQ